MPILLGTAAFVGLPLAALLAVSAARQPGEKPWMLPVAVGVASAALLALPGGGRIGALTRAYGVLLTAAFVLELLLARTPAFLRLALRATVLAGLGTAALVGVVWGAAGWSSLAWESRRGAGMAMRFLVKLWPDLLVLYEPVVRFVSITPVTLAVMGFVGLAVAWAGHRWLTAQPAPPPQPPAWAPITTS